MSPPSRWAGATATAAPAANRVTRQGPSERSGPRPGRGQTPPSGQRELTFGDDQQRLTNSQRAAQFDRENPAVYQLLARLARQWVCETGGRKLGIGALVERVRWEVSLTTTDPHFKINNSYRPWYARELMRREPDLRGLFELRAAEADGTDGQAQP